ncbi:hypothetical protein MUA95_11495 [Staphylococcus agnetis]|uniref:Uncharacterized protein n=1 Tax=Staphylococcus agnetis TaxID=985762 RepID=A0ABD7TW29_9STAP|nr:hypothetical protein [Staphylococcus agnetis]UXU57145.1 hypothetical protein MUA95_11495 [Staphylococcus agnetis]
MELDAFIMPSVDIFETSATPEKWLEELTLIKDMFVKEDIYIDRPIIYTEVPIGLGVVGIYIWMKRSAFAFIIIHSLLAFILLIIFLKPN